MLTKYALVAIIVLCITVLGFTLLVHSSLCELSIKERNIEFKAVSLTNRRSSIRARATPRMGCQDASSAPIFCLLKRQRFTALPFFTLMGG